MPGGCAALPYHSWTYDLTGRLLRAPHTEDVADFTPDEFGLREIEADAWGGFLFLRLAAPAGPALLESLGEMPDRVRRTRSTPWSWGGH